jgi:hypothetical protein
MRKLTLALLGLYISVLAAFAQVADIDSSLYKKRKLKLDEINLVTSYYSQDGNNSAVTGGVGTEQLTDNSNLVELRFVKKGAYGRSQLLNFQVGVDAYSSASSDKIDPATISSPSKSDRRIYPSVTYSLRNDSTRQTIGFIGYYSHEYDYTSFSPGINYSKFSKDKNREFSVRAQAFFDTWKIILPIELRHDPNVVIPDNKRNSFSTSFIYSSVINRRAQFSALLDLAYQNGLLSTPFHRVYFTNDELRVEKLPSTRFKIPFGVRLNYFLGDRFVIRSFYRFYYDTWNMIANTVSIEAPIKITPFLSVGPVYRFYTQTAADYFAPYKQHLPTEEFYASDYDLSAFSSHLVGVNFRAVSASGIMGIKKWNSIDVRYSYYYRTTGLTAHTVALAFKFR